jgi:hypothetical protein
MILHRDIQRDVPDADRKVVFTTQSLLAAGALLCVGMVPLTLGLMLVDTRSLDGNPVWLKPLKFQLSLALHAATLLWMFRHLPSVMQRGLAVRATGFLVGVTVIFEVLFVALQAARGVRSHFNRATLFDQLGGSLMAGGAGILTMVPACLGAVLLWQILRRNTQASDTPLQFSIALGLILSGWLAGQTGGAIGANRGPFVGAAAGPFMPLTGWSFTGGDLRVAHFIGLHIMQILPLAGLAVAMALPRHLAMIAITAVAAFLVWATFAALAAAQAGQSLFW